HTLISTTDSFGSAPGPHLRTGLENVGGSGSAYLDTSVSLNTGTHSQSIGTARQPSGTPIQVIERSFVSAPVQVGTTIWAVELVPTGTGTTTHNGIGWYK